MYFVPSLRQIQGAVGWKELPNAMRLWGDESAVDDIQAVWELMLGRKRGIVEDPPHSLKDLYRAPYCSYCILMIYLIVLRSQPHAYMLTIHRYFHLRKTV